jgi:endonuclease IV
MPEARSFTYTITLAIPKGYVAKGMEEMTGSKSNKTGSFSSVAKVNALGTAVTITVNKNYAHNFEKVEDWGLMKEIIEAASAFNDQKIMFEKKG